MKTLANHPHPYIVLLKHHFISKGSKEGDVYLNLVLDYIPETIHSIVKHHSRMHEQVPVMSVKLYMYQLARALAHIHGLGICHRDIKPQNLLVNPARQTLKLCDFGSAKCLVRGEPNVAYICSRYYRAPELIFGAVDYTVAIDVWSYGCVLAELLLGTPIFPGPTAVDQLVEIVRIIGTPTKDEVMNMNPNYQEYKNFPVVRPPSWPSIFKPNTDSEAIDLVSKLLVYVPTKRLKAIESAGHSFYDALRDPATRIPDAHQPERLFQLTSEELTMNPAMEAKLLPTGKAAAAAK
jgi:serine/threonine protein kinase